VAVGAICGECLELQKVLHFVNTLRHAVRALHQSAAKTSSNLYLRFCFQHGMMRA
jgi:hypothetical protein